MIWNICENKKIRLGCECKDSDATGYKSIEIAIEIESIGASQKIYLDSNSLDEFLEPCKSLLEGKEINSELCDLESESFVKFNRSMKTDIFIMSGQLGNSFDDTVFQFFVEADRSLVVNFYNFFKNLKGKLVSIRKFS